MIITKHNRAHTILLSAALFELFAKGRIARQVKDLDDDTLKAITNAPVTPTPDLDHLLAHWKP